MWQCAQNLFHRIFVLDHSKTTNKKNMMIKLLGEYRFNFLGPKNFSLSHFWIICCTMIWWVKIKCFLKYFTFYQTDSTFPSYLVIRTVTSVKTSVKQHWYHCTGPSKDSTNHRNCILNFLSSNRNGFINKPIMAHTPVLVHRWGPRNKDFGAQFHRWTQPELSFVYDTC